MKNRNKDTVVCSKSNTEIDVFFNFFFGAPQLRFVVTSGFHCTKKPAVFMLQVF